MKYLLRMPIRFCITWVLNSFGLLIAAKVMDGVEIVATPNVSVTVGAMIAGLALTILNTFLRPLILLLTVPLNTLTLGFFSLFLNGLFVFIISYFSNRFFVDNLWIGVLVTLLLAVFNSLLNIFFPIDDDQAYYDTLSQARRRASKSKGKMNSRGIICIEIDGLSYPRFVRAVEKNHMPFVKQLLKSGEYAVDEYDCGIPSQTSSCQAGILYGKNDEIAAFRWYDREKKKVISSNNFSDAAYIEAMLFPGGKKDGLLNQGLSVNNIVSGNAAESIFTVGAMRSKDNDEAAARSRSFYYLGLRPYLLAKSVVFTLLDAAEDCIEYFYARITNKTPRLNRLHNFYPIVRGATNVLLRDMSTAFLADKIVEGCPAMYTTMIGHDEIAHHSGPDSFEAINALGTIDQAIRKIYYTMEESDVRDYDFYILSDHGQSFGATFLQRYGYSLSDYVRDVARECAIRSQFLSVVGIANDADNDANVRAMLEAMKEEGGRKVRIPKRLVGRLEQALDEEESIPELKALQKDTADILVLASGNLVHIYFSYEDHMLDYDEIEKDFPDFCEKLSQHEGVGMIIVRRDGDPIAMGSEGSVNLRTGERSGNDPLEQYGEPEKRIGQLLTLSDYSTSGDIIVISPVYEDGTVASYEELIGSHGGLGGDQTRPFIMHPADVEIPEGISNSREIYPILKSSRMKRARKDITQDSAQESTSFGELIRQIRDVGHWVPILLKMLTARLSVFNTLYTDTALTGPAILVFILSLGLPILAASLLGRMQLSTWTIVGLYLLTYVILALTVESTLLAMRIRLNQSQNAGMIRTMLFSSVMDLPWMLLMLVTTDNAWVYLCFIAVRLVAVVSLISVAGNLSGKKRIQALVVTVIALTALLVVTYMIYETVNVIVTSDDPLDLL